jgi:hypothetical protein
MLTIATDTQGFARFDVSQREGSETWTLECKGTDGAIRSQTFVVAASTTAPAFVAPPITIIGTLRPPLSGDPTKATMQQLIDGGYPPRPDAVASPKSYARWLADVSTPTTLVQDIGRPGPLSHSEDNPIWAGFVIDDEFGPPFNNSGIPFVEAQAEWYVPVLDGYAEPAFSQTQGLSVWPGLSGDAVNGNPSQIVQAGTQSDIVCPSSPYSCGYSYKSWWQWFSSNMLYECPISSTTQAGDDVFAEVYTLLNGAYDSSTSAGACFYVKDKTQNWTFNQCYASGQSVCGNQYRIPSYTGGSSIEWIAERSPQNQPLPEFDDINLFNVFGVQKNFGLNEKNYVNDESFGAGYSYMINSAMQNGKSYITGSSVTNDIMAVSWTDTASDFYIGYQIYE